jgi:hypothetical protein
MLRGVDVDIRQYRPLLDFRYKTRSTRSYLDAFIEDCLQSVDGLSGIRQLVVSREKTAMCG